MLRTLVCLLVILGTASVVNASAAWTNGGDDGNFNNEANWDELMFPPNPVNGWKINKTGVGAAGNWDIHVTADAVTQGGTLYNNGGTVPATYITTLTVDANKTLQMTGVLTWEREQKLIVESGASLIMGPSFAGADQQLSMSAEDAYLKIESEGQAGAGFLYHNDGAVVDLYGTMRLWELQRLANDPGYALNVYDGGLLWVESAIPSVGRSWAKYGRIAQYVGSTVQLEGNRTVYYQRFVKAGEEGEWEVDYGVTRSGYTTIKLVAESPAPGPLWAWADPDGDGDVDQDDFAQFQACYSGDGNYPTDPESCANFDYVEDGKVNADDFAAFTACATGSGIPVNSSTAPDCAGLAMASWEAYGSGAIGHIIGSVLDTSDWRCTTELTPNFMSYGPNVRLQAGEYVARFYLRIDSITEGSPDDVICTLDVAADIGVNQLAGRVLTRSDFTAANEWQRFDLPFTQTEQDHDPANDHQHEFRVWYGEQTAPEDPPGVAHAQLDEDKIDLVLVTTYERPTPPDPGTPGTPYTVSAFATDLDGWTASTWVAGGYDPGVCEWTAAGHPGGSVTITGAGSSHSADACTREGGIIEKAIDTTDKSNLWLHYDIYFACRIEWSGYPDTTGGTSCKNNLVEGDGDDQLAIYCSTDAGASWALVEQVYVGDLELALWHSRQVKLPAEADNNANVMLRFNTQLNNNEDVGYIDNIGLSEGTPPAP